MLTRVRARLSYANVVSTACLLAVLGGTAYAVTQIDGDQIAPRSVPGDRLERNDVGPKEVAGLRAGDFRVGQLPAGPEGPQGPIGPTGPQGSAKAFAFVDPDPTTPTLIHAQGFSAVTKAGFAGGYCLVPSANIHPDNDPAVVSVASGVSGGTRPFIVEWRDSGPDCPAPNQYEVIAGTGSPEVLSDNVGFVLMVP